MSAPHDHLGAPDRASVGAPSADRGAVELDDHTRRGDPAPEFGDSRIRAARREDVAEILAMVRDLATYEQAAHEVLATEQSLSVLLFGAPAQHRPTAAFCHVAPDPQARAGAGDQLSGFALWFVSTSTWTGRHGIYLEDLYVRPQARGRGIGAALMSELAQICVDRDFARLEWSVLDWNTPALDFYRALGAKAMDEWTVHRLTDEHLAALAARNVRG